jgi:regulator of protease activity HflC (stomatin/prohibitin superfamily)
MDAHVNPVVVGLAFCVAYAAWWLYAAVVIVKANTCMVVERSGVFRAVLRPGLHFVWHPLDRFAVVNWSYYEEKESSTRTRRYNSHIIPTENVKLDSVPTKTYTSDHVRVTVNGTLHYRIVDVRKAVYETQDLLEHLCQIVAAASRTVIRQRTHSEVISDELQISDAIKTEITGMAARYGVACTDFITQSMGMDPKITGAIEASIAAERVNSVTLAREQQAHELSMSRHQRDTAERMRIAENTDAVERAHLANALKRRELEHHSALTTAKFELSEYEEHARIERARVVAEAEVASLRARKAADDEAYRIAQLRTVSGLSSQDVITLAMIPHMAQAAGRADKWFIVPNDMGGLASLPIANALFREPLHQRADRQPEDTE